MRSRREGEEKRSGTGWEFSQKQTDDSSICRFGCVYRELTSNVRRHNTTVSQ